jgi:glycine/D-amino acid oxidase-like deaminating enzyme
LVSGTEVTRLEVRAGRVVGAVAADREYDADHVVLAAGAWSPRLAAPLGVTLPVEPGKGQILATHPLPPITTRVINSSGAGVCRDQNGVVLVGSTLEFVGFDKTVSDVAGSESRNPLRHGLTVMDRTFMATNRGLVDHSVTVMRSAGLAVSAWADSGSSSCRT